VSVGENELCRVKREAIPIYGRLNHELTRTDTNGHESDFRELKIAGSNP